MKGHRIGQGNNKFNVKEKANNRANLNYRTDYSCSKCNIQYSTHNDRVYRNRLEHMKTNCIKYNLDIYGEKNKQTHEKKCTKTNKIERPTKNNPEKRTTEPSKIKNYNMFTVLENTEPIQETKKRKNHN